MISFLTAALRSLAQAKGRPPALAEAMADKDLKVYHVRNVKTGQETYISERDFNAKPGEWKKLGEVAASGNDRFLALTGQEAAEVGLADALIAQPRRTGQAIRAEPNCTSSSPPASISPWSFSTGG